MIIFDEEKYCVELLNNKSKVEQVTKGDILRLARYFEKVGMEVQPELKRYILNKVRDYNEVIYDEYIIEAIKSLRYKQLRTCNDIHITKKEVERLNTITDVKMRKFLFMMLALAKYYKYNPAEKNKITTYDKLICYTPLTEINKVGRLGCSKSTLLSYCHYLSNYDYIEAKWYGAYEIKIVDNDWQDDDYLIKPDKDMIYFMNQFTKTKDRTAWCHRCHKWFIKDTRCKVLYCPDCASIVRKEKTRERVQKYRQKDKNE